jgi:hypothetical protein
MLKCSIADVISLPVSPYHGMLEMDILGRFNWQRERMFGVLRNKGHKINLFSGIAKLYLYGLG